MPVEGKSGLALPDYLNPIKGYDFTTVELQALDAIHAARVPYERGKNIQFMKAKKGTCKVNPFTVVGFASKPAIHKDLVTFSRIVWKGTAGSGNQKLVLGVHDAEIIANHLFMENTSTCRCYLNHMD